MSAPYVAGASALVIKARGNNVVVRKSVLDLFQTTAVNIGSTPEKDSLLESVAHQGAGLIQVYHAAKTETLVSPGQISLNDTTDNTDFSKKYAVSLISYFFASNVNDLDTLLQLRILVMKILPIVLPISLQEHFHQPKMCVI